jgi:selenide,water dikinase
LPRAREILPAIERAQKAFDQREIRIAVVGASGRGFETACALRARLVRDGTSATIMLVDGEPQLLPRCPSSARTLAARVLQRLNIASALGARVVELSRRGLRLTSGAIMPADVVVWTAGNAPARGLTNSGMTLDERGFVRFDEMLRSVSHPDVFVAGESADMGTALTDNVAAFCGGAPAPRYRRYQPSSRQFTLLDCGDGSALLAYGGVAREGRMAMRLKESLDRRFISRYQRLAGAT